MEEQPSTTSPATDPAPPPTAGARETARAPWPLRRWWGAGLLGFGTFVTYMAGAQLLPGIAFGVALVAMKGRDAVTEAAIGRHLPMLTAWATYFSILLYAALRILRAAPRPPRPAQRLWQRLGWFAVCLIACYYGQEAIGWFQTWMGVRPQEQSILVDQVRAGGPLIFIALTCLAPLGEELFFRGILFRGLATGCGCVVAALVSSLLFATIHFNFEAFFLYAWMGLCFAFVQERTGTVWAAVLLHVTNNTLAVLYLVGS